MHRGKDAHDQAGFTVPEENETIDDNDSFTERLAKDILELLLKGSSEQGKHVQYRSIVSYYGDCPINRRINSWCMNHTIYTNREGAT
jgi:hypothetical protein